MTYFEDAEMRKGLREPFDPKQIGKLPKPTSKDNRKGECNVCGGWHGLPSIHVDFVGHAAVTDRLNKLDPGWTWEPIERFSDNGRCWIHGTITIGGITRHEYGDGKDPKEAVGNLIRRGAMRFGVAIDLWSKEELEDSSDIEPVPSRVTPGSPGDGMVEEDGSGAPASDPVSEGSAAYGEGAAGSSDRPGADVPPAEGAGEDSHAPSSVEQRKDFRAYLAERYGTAQALLMARSLFQTQTRKVPNMTVLDLDELQAVDVELKARKLETG